MSLRSSPLSTAHAGTDARFTDFGGWEMPVEFDSIRTEHAAVRDSVGKFDVSHMGQAVVSGPDAAELLGRLTTNDVAALDHGDAQYAAITRDDGVMLDDTMVYRLPETHDEYLFIPNAGHDEATVARFRDYRDEWNLDASVENRTTEFAMMAVQGPDSLELFESGIDLHPDDMETVDQLSSLPQFTIASATVAEVETLVARTGYTGEKGFELLCSWDDAETVWDEFECQPCGLGARDTLRLEMGFLLSGDDFSPEDEPRTPYEAGIGFVVDLDTEFVGRDALDVASATEPAQKLVGLSLDERGIPRAGHDVTDIDGDRIGHVTSGTLSPTLGEPVALAYLPADYAEPEREIRVVIRDEPKKGRTRATPFLDR